MEAMRKALEAIADEDWDALGLTANEQRRVRDAQGEADYLVINAMKATARRALEDE